MRQHSFSTSKTLAIAAVYCLLFFAGDLCSSVIFDGIFSIVTLPDRGWYVIFRMTGCLLVTLLFFWLYTTKALHLKMEDFGITLQISGWGAVLSVLLPLSVAAAFLAVGEPKATAFAPGDMILTAAASAAAALKAGVLEEMLFRGFIMGLLEARWNRRTAILIPSLIFGLAHIPSMERFTLGGVALLAVSGTLVGIMFSLAAVREGSIGNSALMHAVWNFVMAADILHITTAEGAYGSPLFQILIPPDSILLTGAGFGAEASLIAAAGYALVCLILVLWKRRTASV